MMASSSVVKTRCRSTPSREGPSEDRIPMGSRPSSNPFARPSVDRNPTSIRLAPARPCSRRTPTAERLAGILSGAANGAPNTNVVAPLQQYGGRCLSITAIPINCASPPYLAAAVGSSKPAKKTRRRGAFSSTIRPSRRRSPANLRRLSIVIRLATNSAKPKVWPPSGPHRPGHSRHSIATSNRRAGGPFRNAGCGRLLADLHAATAAAARGQPVQSRGETHWSTDRLAAFRLMTPRMTLTAGIDRVVSRLHFCDGQCPGETHVRRAIAIRSGDHLPSFRLRAERARPGGDWSPKPPRRARNLYRWPFAA